MKIETYLTHREIEARITARRRYGETTFTWIDLYRDGMPFGVFLDPWPCLRPSKAEIRREIDQYLDLEEKARS